MWSRFKPFRQPGQGRIGRRAGARNQALRTDLRPLNGIRSSR